MPKKTNLKLPELKVKSCITLLEDEKKQVKGCGIQTIDYKTCGPECTVVLTMRCPTRPYCFPYPF